MTIKKSLALIIVSYLSVILISGCATVSQRETFPTYYIGQTAYVPLVSLCEQKKISWEYDAFARSVVLTKDSHKISLMLGDRLALVDGSPWNLEHPVDFYQGMIVVPYKFKERVLDTLFKETYPQQRISAACLKIRKVVIDAGHGGNDPGAIGRTGLREKDVNLDIARRLSKLLNSSGIQVVMTRSIDKFIPLSGRVSITNASNADIFVSIHSNANRVRSLNGFEVYYVATNVDDSKRAYSTAKATALRLTNCYFASYALDLKATLWDMIYTHNRAESVELSHALCNSMRDNLSLKILGIKGARFEVLRGVRMPAVLIEIGFLSNYDEERKLKNSYYRQKIAEAIAQGICDYARNAVLVEAAIR
jgi:N-acetylmuramoyl-L-alanine amidase